MENLTKAFAVAVFVSLTVLIIKKDNPTGAVLLALAAAVLLLSWTMKMLSQVADFFAYTAKYCGISSSLLEPVVKCTGIALITKFGSDFCRDCGQSTVAGTFETVGSAAALYCALPLMQSVLQLLESLI